MTNQLVALWAAINRYVVACGGDPTSRVQGNTSRQTAVVDIEREVALSADVAVSAALEAERKQHGEETGEAYAAGGEDGWRKAHEGIKEVHEREDDGIDTEGLPACRIEWAEDPGDPSVGMDGWASWVLAESQQGTYLELLTRRLAAADQLADAGLALSAKRGMEKPTHADYRMASAMVNYAEWKKASAPLVRRAYTVYPLEDGRGSWGLGIVKENEPGYAPYGGAFPSREAAQECATGWNAGLGLTELEAAVIIGSSMCFPRE